MNELISMILLELAASFWAKIESKDIGSSSVRLNKFSADETLASRYDLIANYFSVHHN
jgi:hypothetical protein